MVFDSEFDNLKFKLQNHEFQNKVGLLDVKSYDLILGADWLVGFGPMLIDWNNGAIKFHKDNKGH